MGCHAGLNVPDARSPRPPTPAARIDPRLDIAQAIAQQRGVLVGEHGLRVRRHRDDRRHGGLDRHLRRPGHDAEADSSALGSGQSIGLALAAAKRQYLGLALDRHALRREVEHPVHDVRHAAVPARLRCASHRRRRSRDRRHEPRERGRRLRLPAKALRPDRLGRRSRHSLRVQLEEASTHGAARYIAAGGDTQATADRPIQPRVVIDLGPATALR